ncbi:protein Bv8 precursor, putative [Pediculus humanus corporis]|uniref:Protein Bv8, putative n=1 Tax=Pediculus humanus subsp. corporis TaxID=121224 RepID=E0VYH3_PEDHC|nr:protein Bv8 precursor, putative [Pediculus humanus corporis]EEB18429.1 protein Bv8 precursor, putative [Pediculus humanus corporis]
MMKKEFFKSALFASVFLILLTASIVDTRPPYIECSDTLECGLGYCCVLGNGRYSLPRCVQLGKINDYCRPGNLPLNVTVSYPDGENVELSHIYSTMCPCQEGLYCSDNSGMCIDQLEDLLLNTI